jgi:cytochrome c peroxidase
MSLDTLPAPPRDGSNAVEAVPAAAALGERLFSEVRFSRNQAVSCASYHAPERQFQDGLAVGKGVGIGARRTMPIAGVAHNPCVATASPFG